MFYLGKEYTATATATNRTEFVCGSCEHRQWAMAVGIGSGTGHSPFLVANEYASNRAHESASQEADWHARVAISGAKCPKCGRRDSHVVRGVYTRALVFAILWGALVAVAVVAMLRGSTTGWYLGAIAGFGVVIVKTYLAVTKAFSPVIFESEGPSSR